MITILSGRNDDSGSKRKADTEIQTEKIIADQKIKEAEKQAESIVNEAYEEAAAWKTLSEKNSIYAEADKYLSEMDRSDILQKSTIESIEEAQRSSIQIQKSVRESFSAAKDMLISQIDEECEKIKSLIDEKSLQTVKMMSDWRGDIYEYKYTKLMNAYSNLFQYATRVVPDYLKVQDDEGLERSITAAREEIGKIQSNFDKVMISLNCETGKE